MPEGSWKDRFWSDWEGNRRLTVAVARAFPGESLWATPVPPMRSFGLLLEEVLGMEQAFRWGLAEGRWDWQPVELPRSDPWPAVASVREKMRGVWASIPIDRLTEVTPDPFGMGMPPQSMVDRLQYLLENEIHHRGQGYVYLRLQGIEPPPFWTRD